MIRIVKVIREINSQVVLYVKMDIFWIQTHSVYKRRIFTKIKTANGETLLTRQNVMFVKKDIIKCLMVKAVYKCQRIEYQLEINS